VSNTLVPTDAFERHKRIVALRNRAVKTFLELGEELYWFEKLKQYRELEHPTFESYLADPDVDISRDIAFRLKRVYKTFELKLKVAPALLLQAGYDKLVAIHPHITEENAEEWINKAASLSRSDLRIEIREHQHQNIIEPPPLEGKYRVIYADPPWKYASSGPGLDQYGPAERHYPSLSIEELSSLPVKDVAEDNAVLFLWVTSPLLEECFRVIDAWGFKYKTSFVWDKVGHNYGHYNSVRHEFLLVCTRGSCVPDNKSLYDSVQSIQKSRTHSEKPEAFRKIIDDIYTHGNRIELFARKQSDGWDRWGNEPE